MLTNTNTHAGAQQALFDRALLEILQEDVNGGGKIWQKVWKLHQPLQSKFKKKLLISFWPKNESTYVTILYLEYSLEMENCGATEGGRYYYGSG